MYRFAVGLAVVAALLIAVGAALQSRTALDVTSPGRGRIAFLVVLVRQPRWLLGALASGCGVAAHVVALSLGPVTAIQPVGTVGLIFAIGAASALDRSRPRARAVVGSVIVIVGLAAFLLALPSGSGATEVPVRGTLAMAALAVVLAGSALALPRERVGLDARAAAVAVGAAASFGVGAALTGVIGHRVSRSASAVLAWPTLVVIVLLVVGGVAQQYAYRLARFAEVYAVLLVVDPLTAAFTGVLVFGDPFPTAPGRLAWLALAGGVTTAGVVMLSHHHPGHRREGWSR